MTLEIPKTAKNLEVEPDQNINSEKSSKITISKVESKYDLYSIKLLFGKSKGRDFVVSFKKSKSKYYLP